MPKCVAYTHEHLSNTLKEHVRLVVQHVRKLHACVAHTIYMHVTPAMMS